MSESRRKNIDIKQIEKLYKIGLGRTLICQRLGYSESAVGRALRQLRKERRV